MRKAALKNISSQEGADKEVENRYLWIQYDGKILYFSPADGFEKKEFKNRGELMQFAKACVSAGYLIG